MCKLIKKFTCTWCCRTFEFWYLSRNDLKPSLSLQVISKLAAVKRLDALKSLQVKCAYLEAKIYKEVVLANKVCSIKSFFGEGRTALW